MENFDLSWMEEEIESIPKNNWLYKFSCFMLTGGRRKLTYKEMYLLLSRLNEKTLGEELSKKVSFEEILNIYKFNNNKLPEK